MLYAHLKGITVEKFNWEYFHFHHHSLLVRHIRSRHRWAVTAVEVLVEVDGFLTSVTCVLLKYVKFLLHISLPEISQRTYTLVCVHTCIGEKKKKKEEDEGGGGWRSRLERADRRKINPSFPASHSHSLLLFLLPASLFSIKCQDWPFYNHICDLGSGIQMQSMSIRITALLIERGETVWAISPISSPTCSPPHSYCTHIYTQWKQRPSVHSCLHITAAALALGWRADVVFYTFIWWDLSCAFNAFGCFFLN